MDWDVFPALTFSSDDGLGFGARANITLGDARLYRPSWRILGRALITTEGAQDSGLDVVISEVLGWPLGVEAGLGFGAQLSDNYCGVGREVTCDPAIARSRATALGLSGEERDLFVRRFYETRYMRPTAQVLTRWRLHPWPTQLEALVGWRGALHIDGDFAAQDPYPGSLYAEHHPDGETGLVSALLAGLVLDSRDWAPAPTRGYLVEATLRGSARPWGSDWDFFGGHLALHGYVPLTANRSAVLAARAVVEASVGDVPTHEMRLVGGLDPYPGFGGADVGRGLRRGLLLGRLKAYQQTEVRYTFYRLGLAKQLFDLIAVGLLDVGTAGYDWSDLRGDPRALLWGGGGGLRVIWNHAMVFRLDVAASPFEQQGPRFYLGIDHTY